MKGQRLLDWRLGHRPALDALRGIAVLMVLAWHARLPFGRGGSWMGVTVFFVLSGFLITRLLLEERADTGRIRWGAFYIRRVRRLVPALVAMVAVTVLAGWLLLGRSLWREGVVALSYLGNWAIIDGHFLGPLGHVWTLAIEEQFYIVWPAVIGLLALLRPRFAVVILVLGIMTSIAVRQSSPELRASVGTDARADALLYGALAAFVVGRVTISLVAAAVATALLVILMVLEPHPFGIVAGLTLAPPLIALVILGTIEIRSAPAWLRGTGRISYGLYLWHYAPMLLLAPIIDPWPLRAVVLFGIAFALALVSWRYVERPLLRSRTPDTPAVGGQGQPDSSPQARAETRNFRG